MLTVLSAVFVLAMTTSLGPDVISSNSLGRHDFAALFSELAKRRNDFFGVIGNDAFFIAIIQINIELGHACGFQLFQL